MRHCNNIWRVLAVAAILGGLASLGVSPAAAVVIAGNGSNTPATYPDSSFAGTSFPGTAVADFSNVGTNPSDSDSVIYVGNQWVLMAYHSVYFSSDANAAAGIPSAQTVDFTVNGVTTGYTTDPTTFHQLYCPSAGSGYPSDVVLLKLSPTTPCALPSLLNSISTTAPTGWMVGLGQGPQNQSTSITYWNSSGGTLAGPSGAAYSGFTYSSSPRALRWGDAQVSGTAAQVPDGNSRFGVSNGVTDTFYTTFLNNGNPNEMQAAPGDSGGGVFSYNTATSSWLLSGMIIGTSNNGGIGNAVTFGSSTYAADLGAYGGQITTIAPEPSTMALLAGGAAAFLARRLWRARRRR
ncbi:MAG: PEP-CTERM sorting domain-containing protein [Thermoguttaceae bacterium]|jgi:hypothetical protein